jgi:hypothetical protein
MLLTVKRAVARSGFTLIHLALIGLWLRVKDAAPF